MEREKQKQEAIVRMKMLKVISDAIKQFRDDDTVMVSEGGILYWLNKEQKEIVSRFEKEYGGLVYMVMHNRTELGELYSMLFVGDEENMWDVDKADIANDDPVFACTYNVNGPQEYELGSIVIKPRFGGVIRIG